MLITPGSPGAAGLPRSLIKNDKNDWAPRIGFAYDLNGNTGTNFFAPLSSASGAASAIALSSAVAGNPQAIAASQDGAAGNNVAALAIGNLLHNPVFNGGSVTDQYSSLVFNIGNDTANAQAGFKEHDAMVSQLQNQMQSISGVSIDEETAQILQFQRSFQASSKVISGSPCITE